MRDSLLGWGLLSIIVLIYLIYLPILFWHYYGNSWISPRNSMCDGDGVLDSVYMSIRDKDNILYQMKKKYTFSIYI